jgi:hypothetical protein
MLRRTVGRPVRLGFKPHLGPKTTFLLLSGSCEFIDVGAPSLTRGRVCRLHLLLGLARTVILWSEFRGNYYHILRHPHPPNLEGQVPVVISLRKRVPQLCPLALGALFVASYDRHGYGGGIRTRLHTGSSLQTSIDEHKQFSSYLTGNTLRLRYRPQPDSAVYYEMRNTVNALYGQNI